MLLDGSASSSPSASAASDVFALVSPLLRLVLVTFIICLSFQLILIVFLDRLRKVLILQLHALFKLHKILNVCSNLLDLLFIFPASVPHGNRVLIRSQRYHQTQNLVFCAKLFTYQRQQKIFPVFISMGLWYFEEPSPAIFASLIFPHRLDTIHKLHIL